MVIEKPQLRGTGFRAYGYAMGATMFVTSAFALWYKKNVIEARQKHYRDFYDKWDDDKEFEAMRKTGIFKGFEL